MQGAGTFIAVQIIKIDNILPPTQLKYKWQSLKHNISKDFFICFA